MQPIECACQACRAMCADSVCMPTPAQVQALIERGFAERLARYDPRGAAGEQRPRFVAPAPVGLEGATLASTSGHGACTFFDGAACELHALGLKPQEGRLAHHSRPAADVRRHVYMSWLPQATGLQSLEGAA